LLIKHDDDYSFPRLWTLFNWAFSKAYKSGCKLDRTKLSTLSKTNNTMSAAPVFSFATTAQEVATAFSEEIRGKNGIFFPCFRR
jgi:hypothetical protein